MMPTDQPKTLTSIVLDENNLNNKYALVNDKCTSVQQIEEAYAEQLKEKININTVLDIVCVECNEKLSFVRSHQRSVQRSGIQIDVASHFSHQPNSTRICGGESYEHKLAKMYLVQNLFDFEFFHTCVCCNRETVIDVFQRQLNSNMENVVIKPEYRHEGFIFDVGVVRKSDGVLNQTKEDDVIGCVEICHTHACDDHKLTKITELGLAWVEIHAKSVLTCIDEQDNDLFPKRIQTMNCPLSFDLCPVCEQMHQQQINLTYVQECIDMAEEQRKTMYVELREKDFKQKKLATMIEENTLLSQALGVTSDKDLYDLLAVCTKRSVALRQLKMFNIDKKYVQMNMLMDPQLVFPFGKHQHHHVCTVMELDPSYIQWYVLKGKSEPMFDKTSPLYLKAQELLSHKCEVCFIDLNKDSPVWHTMCSSCFNHTTSLNNPRKRIGKKYKWKRNVCLKKK